MMRGPPAEPSASMALPSGPRTMVGDMALRARFPGSTRLATGRPPRSGTKLKSASSLFRCKPFATRDLPHGSSLVEVTVTRSQALSLAAELVVEATSASWAYTHPHTPDSYPAPAL